MYDTLNEFIICTRLVKMCLSIHDEFKRWMKEKKSLRLKPHFQSHEHYGYKKNENDIENKKDLFKGNGFVMKFKEVSNDQFYLI